MKGLKLKMICAEEEERFIVEVEAFMKIHDIFSVKFQRNLYYAGVGSSDGFKGKSWFPWSKKNREQRKIAKGTIKLQSSFLAFIAYKGRR